MVDQTDTDDIPAPDPQDGDAPDASAGASPTDPEGGDPRVELAAEAEHLREQLTDLDDGEEALAFDGNFADRAEVAAEQGENRLLASELREQLDDVERALGKLDEGTYGTCEVCGGAIGADRLDAMPATRYCIDHAG